MEETDILLVGYRIPPLRQLARVMTGSALDETTDVVNWKIENKYYVADVSLSFLSIESLGTTLLPLPPPTCQAIVLVFDATSDSGFDTIRKWWEISGITEDIEVKLAVAFYPGGRTSDFVSVLPPHVLAAEQWCIEHMYELIHVDRKHLDSFSNGSSYAVDAEEGMDRLVQALHAHMWPGLKGKVPHIRQGPVAEISPPGDDIIRGGADRMEEDALMQLLAGEHGTDASEVDELDVLFSEISFFKDKMAGADHATRASRAGEMLLRLQALLGEEEDNNDDAAETQRGLNNGLS